MRDAAVVTTIGRCGACLKMAALERGVCGRCRERFGERFAQVVARVRRDPHFARACFDRIQGADRRSRFIEWFGDPHLNRGS